MRIDEIRQPDVSYTEVATGREVTKIVAELSASKSKALNKIAEEYKKIDIEIKELNLERDKLNTNVKSKLLSFFDLEDKVYTRVIKTTKLVATLNRDSEPGSKLDLEGFILEVGQLIAELGIDIQEIRNKYTTINKASRAPGLKVQLENVNESLVSSVETAIEIMTSKFKHYFNKKMNRFDDKFYNLIERIKMTFF